MQRNANEIKTFSMYCMRQLYSFLILCSVLKVTYSRISSITSVFFLQTKRLKNIICKLFHKLDSVSLFIRMFFNVLNVY